MKRKYYETIIDRDTWERVQELRKQRKRPNRYDDVGLGYKLVNPNEK